MEAQKVSQATWNRVRYQMERTDSVLSLSDDDQEEKEMKNERIPVTGGYRIVRKTMEDVS